jgi:hypothetical protein
MNLKQSVSSTVSIPIAPAEQCSRTALNTKDLPVDLSRCELVIHDSIEEIPRKSWDSLIGDSPITRSFDYLLAIQKSSISGSRYYYPVIYDREKNIVAHACIYTVTTDFSQLLPKWITGAVLYLRKFWPSLLSVEITECGTPLSWGCSISVVRGLSRPAILPFINDAMIFIAEKSKSRLLVIRDFLESERDDSDEQLTSLGYQQRSNYPLARIHVRWNSYDEYIGSFRARYRKDIRRRIRIAESAGNNVEILDSFGSESSRWAKQASVIREQTKGFRREALPPLYYQNMDRVLRHDSKLLVINNRGEKVAHGMIIFDRETTTATFFGRESGPPKGEWFQLINSVIRIGIERGSKYISLGLGSYDGKSIVGADIEPLVIYRRSTLPIFNAFINLIPDLMKPKVLLNRNLFKANR